MGLFSLERHLRFRLHLASRCGVILGLMALTLPAAAQSAAPASIGPDLNSKFAIDEANPEASVPSGEQAMKNPLEMGYLLMDLIARAEAATQRGDHPAAIRYYRAMAKAVPERAVSFSKMCQAYEALGALDKALENCQLALGKGGATLQDYAAFVRLTLKQEAALSDTQLEEVTAVITHLREQAGSEVKTKVVAAQLACELATKLDDSAGLRSCVSELQSLAPGDARTLTFGWALSMQARDFDAAAKVIASARKYGLPSQVITDMEGELSAGRTASFAPLAWLGRHGSWAALLLLALALLGLSRLRKKPELTPA